MRRLRWVGIKAWQVKEAGADPQPQGWSALPRVSELRKKHFSSRWSLDEAQDSPLSGLCGGLPSLSRGLGGVGGFAAPGLGTAKVCLPHSAGKGSMLFVLSSSRWSQQWSLCFPVSRAPGGAMVQDIQVRCELLLDKSRRAVWFHCQECPARPRQGSVVFSLSSCCTSSKTRRYSSSGRRVASTLTFSRVSHR